MVIRQFYIVLFRVTQIRRGWWHCKGSSTAFWSTRSKCTHFRPQNRMQSQSILRPGRIYRLGGGANTPFKLGKCMLGMPDTYAWYAGYVCLVCHTCMLGMPDMYAWYARYVCLVCQICRVAPSVESVRAASLSDGKLSWTYRSNM